MKPIQINRQIDEQKEGGSCQIWRYGRTLPSQIERGSSREMWGTNNIGSLNLDDDGLRGRQQHIEIVRSISKFSQERLHLNPPFILDPSLLHIEAQEQLPVTMFVPAHPVTVLPRRHFTPRLDLSSRK